MKLQRGFKTDAERLSLKVRYELNLKAYNCLNGEHLAAHLGITVLSVSQVPGMTLELEETVCSEDFSAVAIVSSKPPIIIHNHQHALTRRESNLMHEIAHCMLKHRPKPNEEQHAVLLHSYDREQEAEAVWLGGCLQIPREGLLWAINKGLDNEEIASQFEASLSMVKYRRSTTGIDHQIRNRKKKYS